MRSRKDILNDLINLNGELNVLHKEISQYEWDIDEPLLIISKKALSSILKKSLEKKISKTDLENWANAIECRDDIDFEEEYMQEIIFELANPTLNDALTDDRLKEMISSL